MESVIILTIFALILNVPPIGFIYIQKKDRKKYFILSSIYAIFVSFLFFKFGNIILSKFNLKQGLINYVMYVYKNLFIFSPLLGLFFVSIHKVFDEKKQLIKLIALKYFFPIFIYLIFVKFLKLSHLLWLLAGFDIFTTILSVVVASIRSSQK